MSAMINLTGKKFGKLTVLEFSETIKKHAYWKCKCDCGKEKIICGVSLRHGYTNSCGCNYSYRKTEFNPIPPKTKFNRWTVIEFKELRNSAEYYSCICDCGNSKIVRGIALKNGSSKSCGCLVSETMKIIKRTHGATINYKPTNEYTIYKSMISRCHNKNNPAYKSYGGRGIVVCERWLNSFESFVSDMGNRPSKKYSIDRINNDGNYEPSNCRWATAKEQANNRRPQTKRIKMPA